MKELLITVMLIIVAITMYMGSIGNEDGLEVEIKESGEKMGRVIERINFYEDVGSQ